MGELGAKERSKKRKDGREWARLVDVVITIVVVEMLKVCDGRYE